MKILLVEDELQLGNYIKKGLTEAGFLVEHHTTGLDGYHALMTQDFNVVVMDVMLPDISGFELIKNYRRANHFTPVLFLTAKDDVSDRIKGIEIGGDDYLTKPFAFAELLVRIKNLLRRATQADYKSTTLELADLKMDIAKRTVYRGADLIKLTAKEFALLQFLLERCGEVLPRSIIASQVWDMNFDSDTNVIDVAIRRLRKKVDDDYEVKLIHTVRGMGYRLESPVSTPAMTGLSVNTTDVETTSTPTPTPTPTPTHKANADQPENPQVKQVSHLDGHAND